MLGNDSPIGSPPRRRRVVSWWFSIVLAIALLASLGTVLYETVLNRASLSGTVVDAYTQAPVAGVTIVAGQKTTTTDSRGHFSFGGKIVAVSAAKPGYDTARATVISGVDSVRLQIRPNVVHGTVVSKADRKPIAGASISVVEGSNSVGSTTTDAAGNFTLARRAAGRIARDLCS